MTPAHQAPVALTAVLREIAPRAAVLAELVCGDPAQAQAALTDATEALGRELQQGPVQGWTQRFWSLLLAAPSLRTSPRGARWEGDLATLAALSPGLRAVLLLRLVARLDDAEAADALRIPLHTQLRALCRALPRTADGRADAARWQALRTACERRLRQGPDPRKGGLDRLFALAAHATHRGRTRWWNARRASWLVLAACAVALGITFVWQPLDLGWNRDQPAKAIPLPPASAPASTFDADSAVLTHPDYDALAAPGDLALADDLAFYAWYAAQLAQGPNGSPLLFPDAGAPLQPAGAVDAAR